MRLRSTSGRIERIGSLPHPLAGKTLGSRRATNAEMAQLVALLLD